MSRIIISGGDVVTQTDERSMEVVVSDGLILAVGINPEFSSQDGETIDASGCWVTPGLIDLQVNGGPGCDFWDDPTENHIAAFSETLVKAGVTTILPTLITDDLTHLRKNVDFLENCMGVGSRQLSASTVPGQQLLNAGQLSATAGGDFVSVRMPGIHLEGPCLSPQRPGVHPKQHLQPLTMPVAESLVSKSVKLITVAPELDPTGLCVAFFRSQGIVVALGHSNASYEQAKAAFDGNIAMMTHTYNALPPIHHRAPGAVVAALLDDRVDCCLICDGQHVSPPAAELVIRSKGVAHTILVTDIAHVGTSQGGLVGSSILLDQAVRNVVKWGIASFSDAIRMSTFNPARAMGWSDQLGEIAAGKLADIVIWDRQSLVIKHVISRGIKVF